MEVSAPAKINFNLRVLGRRADGFHDLETLMLPLSLSDTLVLERTGHGGVRLQCDDPALPAGRENLVVRAAELFLESAGVRDGVRIELRKRVPHGAGLGGGSSDAAATLAALNAMFDRPLDAGRLAELAAAVGSDVAFFLAGGPAVCRGRGERVEPAAIPGKYPLLLVKPPFGVPTSWAYSRWSASREIPGVQYAPQAIGGALLFNDLERPVFEKYLFLAALKMWLIARPETLGALMSGSGSTVFAVLRDEAAGEVLEEVVRAEFGTTLWVCRCSG